MRHRMLALDGTTDVDAAHIHQFTQGGPNVLTNRIVLSKTAPCLFGCGFWFISEDHRCWCGTCSSKRPVRRSCCSDHKRGNQSSCPTIAGAGPRPNTWTGIGADTRSNRPERRWPAIQFPVSFHRSRHVHASRSQCLFAVKHRIAFRTLSRPATVSFNLRQLAVWDSADVIIA